MSNINRPHGPRGLSGTAAMALTLNLAMASLLGCDSNEASTGADNSEATGSSDSSIPGVIGNMIADPEVEPETIETPKTPAEKLAELQASIEANKAEFNTKGLEALEANEELLTLFRDIREGMREASAEIQRRNLKLGEVAKALVPLEGMLDEFREEATTGDLAATYALAQLLDSVEERLFPLEAGETVDDLTPQQQAIVQFVSGRVALAAEMVDEVTDMDNVAQGQLSRVMLSQLGKTPNIVFALVERAKVGIDAQYIQAGLVEYGKTLNKNSLEMADYLNLNISLS